MPSYTVYSEIVTINAPIDSVWQVLLDFDRYPDWNPFTYRVETDLTLHSPVALYVKLPGWGSRLQIESVHEVTEPTKLSWGMTLGTAFLLTALREQTLTSVTANQCTYQSTDAFSGLLTPVVRALFANSIRNGFNAMAYALKARVEPDYSVISKSML